MSDAAYVVVGAGVTAARAVEALRKDGVEGSVTLIGDEPHAPYERPELSKGFLAGKTGRDELDVLPASWYVDHDVELLLGSTARSIDRGNRTVHLDNSERIGYDRLLLATGSAVRRLDLPGADLDGVLALRRVDDSEAIRSAITGDGPVVVIGAGWIGLEVAAAARAAGRDVTILESAAAPLAGVLGPEVGARFARLHEAQGTTVRTGVTVTRITGSGRAEGVVLDDGTVIPAATVITGVGITPRTELAEAAGLGVDDGVLVDTSLRTADERIWAAGDVANAENSWVGHRLRVEHFATANDQGTFAGHSMAGSEETWGVAPFFWSDQFSAGLEYRGYAEDGDHVVLRANGDGSADDEQWAAFWLDGDDRVQAGLHVNLWDDADAVKALVVDRSPVDPTRLADPTVPLAEAAND